MRSAWRWAREQAIDELMQPAIAPIQDDEKWEPEGKRLHQAWRELLPQKNPYTRRQVEDPDWLPARIPLADRPQCRYSAALISTTWTSTNCARGGDLRQILQ